MPTSAVILTAVILLGVIISDLGHRAVSAHRLRRPLIIAGIAGSMYLTAFATSGAGLLLELAGLSTGALLGIFAASFMRVERNPHNGQAFTRAGIGYVLVWVAAAATRLAFIYGSQHWFFASLDSWMFSHHITADVLTDALVLEALAMTCARTLSLLIRSRSSLNPRLGNVRIADSAI